MARHQKKHLIFAQRVGLTAISNLLVSVSWLILLPILTKTLSTADYGSWSLILATIMLVPNLVALGLEFAILRFLPASDNKRDTRELFYSVSFLVLFTSIVASGLFFAFSRQITASFLNGNVIAGLVLPFNIFFACINAFLSLYFLAFQQMKRYSVIAVLQAYLNVALISYFIYSGAGLEGAVIGLLAEQFVVFLVNGSLIVREIGFVIPRFLHMRKYVRFGLPFLPSRISSWIVSSSDRYLIGIVLGTVAVGYYSPAYALGTAITILSAPFSTMLLPTLSKHYEEGSLEDVRTIMKYSLKYYLGAAIPSFFVLSILSRPLLEVLSTEAIATNGYLVTPFVAAAMVLVGAYEVVVPIVELKMKTAIVGTTWTISAVLNFGLNIALIPYLGIVGAAVATLFAFACAFVLITAYSLRRFVFDINRGFILKSIAASLVASGFLVLWHPTGVLEILTAIGVSVAIYLGTLFALRGVTVEELRFFYHVFKGAGSA